MGKLFLAIRGSLGGDLQKLPYAGSEVSNKERLWCVYQIKDFADYIIVADHLTYKQAKQYISEAEKPKPPPDPLPTKPTPVIKDRDTFILSQIRQGVPIKKVAEDQGLSRQRIAKIWQKHNPGISLRELHRTNGKRFESAKALKTPPVLSGLPKRNCSL